METSPDQQTELVFSTPFEDWASLLVLLQKLQTRLAEDRQSWAATGGDMAYLVEALRLELQKLQEMNHQLTTLVSPSFETTIQRFNQAAEQAASQTRHHQDTLQKRRKWGWGLVLILCVLSSISGGSIVHWLHP